MAILTVGVVPVAEVLPLLTEHIREEQITHISLLGKMTREDVMEDYALDSGDERLLTLLNDNQPAEVSRQKWPHGAQCYFTGAAADYSAAGGIDC
jgi:protein AroM